MKHTELDIKANDGLIEWINKYQKKSTLTGLSITENSEIQVLFKAL